LRVTSKSAVSFFNAYDDDMSRPVVQNHLVEPFLPTLIGAFLGISIPAVLVALREWIGYRRALNTVFAYIESETQGYRARARYVRQQVERDSQMSVEKLRSVAATNFGQSAETVAPWISQYSRFLRAEDVFHLVQDTQNVHVLLNNLQKAIFEDTQTLVVTLEQVVEFSARRAFDLFCIAKRTHIEFTTGRYNALIEALNSERKKRVTKVRKKRVERAD